MMMPGRKYQTGSGYRYGFNGKEKSDEIAAGDLDFGARIYDGRLGQWLSVDNCFSKYPEYSPYIFAANNPIIFVDVDGNDIIKKIRESYSLGIPITYHGLGETNYESKNWANVKFNKKTSSYDIEIGILIKYSTVFKQKYDIGNGTKGTIETENPGIFTEVSGHEKGHAEQFYLAAKSVINLTSSISGTEKKYSGTGDKVITQVYNDYMKNAKAQFDKGHIGKTVTKEDESNYTKTIQEIFTKTILPNLQTDVLNKMVDAIPNAMKKQGDLEKDANSRAEKSRGGTPAKYGQVEGTKESNINYKGKPLKGT
jgi:RHS repeat-associated protein